MSRLREEQKATMSRLREEQKATMSPTRTLVVGASAMLLAGGLTAAPALADDVAPLHHVKYTLTAAAPIYAQVYYLDHEPAIFADWSHNPYEFMPNIEVDLGPGASWSYDLQLEDPYQWAMVMAHTGPEPGAPNFHCEIAVDGAVVVSNDGADSVLCSIRTW